MITIKDAAAIAIMRQAGILLAQVFDIIEPLITPGISSLELDRVIERELVARDMQGPAKGYHGYAHVSCISLNDEVVHGVPSERVIVKASDVVKVDVCARWHGYCVDMTRSFLMSATSSQAQQLVKTAQQALAAGIAQAVAGNRLGDISAAIQDVVQKQGFGIVRDYAGHGIGKQMHEAPEIANMGRRGVGPLLKEGMVFALEPMITAGDYRVYVANDGWTVKTKDNSLAAHVEDTVLITQQGPHVLTRLKGSI